MSTRIPRKASLRNRAVISLLVAVLLVFACSNDAHLAIQQATNPQSGAAIIGTIQDDHGLPVGNAKVTLSSGDVLTSRSTQADGKFEFHNLKPAQYRITVEAARFRKESVNITLRPDETYATPPIKLIPSSLHVAVLDIANQPLSGVIVSLYGKERSVVGALAARSVTDEYGDAYFGKLAPGSFQLSATLRGYDEYRNDVFISSGITTEFPLQLLVAPVIPMNEKASVRYTVPNLPSKNVETVFQDSEGWMWFGTDKGVARFNGSEFKSSSSSGLAFELLSGEEVRSIAEDKTGTIWLATSRGIHRIGKNGEENGHILDVPEPRQIIVDSNGNIWVGARDGIARFDGKAFAWLPHQSELASAGVRALAEDKNGVLWIATSKTLFTLEGQKLSSFQQWRDSRGLKPQPDEPSSISEIRNLFVDSDGRIWLGTDGDAWLIDNGRVVRQTIESRNAGSKGSTIRAISEDLHGRMWFALEAGGVIVHDPAKRESQRINFLDRDRVSSITAGRDGFLWFATDNGVIGSDFYGFVSFTTSRGLADNDVQQIVQAPDGPGGRVRSSLWFLTLGGVSRLESERLVPVEGFRSGISVQAVAFDQAGNAWFATDQGGLRWTGESLTQFNEGSGLASNNVQWVSAISGGSAIVFATTRGASVFRDGSLKSLDALAGYDVRHVFEDTDGRLWFATGRGVVSVDQKGRTELIDTSRGLADNDARWIARFDDRLVIATRAGIQAYNGGSAFSTIDPEPTATMFVDRDGFLWSGTDEGRVKKLLEFGGHILSSVYSGEPHALTGSRVNSISQDPQGNIWIATNKGAVRHIPIKVPPVAQIVLEVDGRVQTPADSGSYYVSYGRHRLTFRFSAACTSGQARYVYRINSGEGEPPWEAMPVQQGAERDFSRIDPDEGTHTFELVVLNRDLYGAKSPAATLSVRVGLPFWKRWWFYALTLALVVLALGGAFLMRLFGDREYVLPKELRAFVPIDPNPFIVGNPIRTEKMFYGREDDFRYVRTKLEGTSQGVVIVFCGERRAGKSSILYQVAGGRLGERFIPVFIDLQEMVIASDSEFFARISKLIYEAVVRANTGAPGESVREALPAAEAVVMAGAAQSSATGKKTISQPVLFDIPRFDGRNPYPIFLDFLDDVLASIGDRTLLILMDEYELLEGKVDEGKLSNELFTFLAGLMDNKERLALIFTGSRRLEERDRKYWRELLRRSLFRKVGFLSEKDTVRLITEPVRSRVVYGRGVMDVIYRLTSGQPFYTQVICQNVVDYMNEHSQNWLTVADLGQVITEIVDNPLPQMIYSWDALSDDEKLVLSLLGEVLTDGIAYATARELRTSVKDNDYPVNLSENSMRLTLEEMFRRELLEKDPEDGFRFKIDLLRLWIRRSHSIWQVVKEVRTL